MPFKPGTSGNPAGRPSEYKRSASLRMLISKSAPDVVDVVVKAALAGDTQAARILLERSIPPLKPCAPDPAIQLPNRKSLTARAGDILRLLNTGSISIEAAGELLSALSAFAKLREADELESRIAALESKKP